MRIKVRVTEDDRDNEFKAGDIGVMISFTNLGRPYESHPVAAVIIGKKIVLIPYFKLEVLDDSP